MIFVVFKKGSDSDYYYLHLHFLDYEEFVRVRWQNYLQKVQVPQDWNFYFNT